MGEIFRYREKGNGKYRRKEQDIERTNKTGKYNIRGKSKKK
jgi:hypothetical protein